MSTNKHPWDICGKTKEEWIAEVKAKHEIYKQDTEERIENKGDAALLWFCVYLYVYSAFMGIAGFTEYAVDPVSCIILCFTVLPIAIWGNYTVLRRRKIRKNNRKKNE